MTVVVSIVKNTSGSWTTIVLASIIVVQWILLTVLLHRSHERTTLTTNEVDVLSSDVRMHNKNEVVTTVHTSTTSSVKLDGVAVTVMYRAPKWFHLRYKVMIDNALANLPDPATWKVQIFINEHFQNDQNLLDWNPGLVHMFHGNDPRVIVTPLPLNLTGHNNKPKDVLFSSWFWESVAADRAVLFSGNGAFCGNQLSDGWKRNDLLDLDYLGVPSFDFDRVGGDGSSHSLRRRSAMMRIIQYRKDHTITTFNHPEDHETLKTMLEMNQKKSIQNDDEAYIPFRVASKEQTIAFGGVYDLTNNVTEGVIHIPLVVAGTQPRLTYTERDTLLKHCPELKVIFPSLHEPSCFGAHPNAETCKASICALQDKVPSHGC